MITSAPPRSTAPRAARALRRSNAQRSDPCQLPHVPPHLGGGDRPRDRRPVRDGEAHDGASHAPAGADDAQAHQRDARADDSAAETAATTAALVVSSTGTSGKRTVAFIAPRAASAAFTGPGFASRNMAS